MSPADPRDPACGPGLCSVRVSQQSRKVNSDEFFYLGSSYLFSASFPGTRSKHPDRETRETEDRWNGPLLQSCFSNHCTVLW
ncbi:hypothetical protein GN956_G13839 [Arapaima gigas]